jgi:hypothetical protein
VTQTLESVFRPTPPQEQFLRSPALLRAYGGGLGGGKSFAMCQAVFDYSLDFPGLVSLIARDKHTSIINTTRKTMLEQVIPRAGGIIAHKKQSQGEDYIKLFNDSEIHFVGMDDPYRWYSSEIGVYALDEAQEITNNDSEKVIRLIQRLRQRCSDCIEATRDLPPEEIFDCEHLPHKAMMSFNPSSPDHWLYNWFIKGAQKTDYGFRKHELVLPGAEDPIGDAEFVFALAADNPYLSRKYMGMLGGLPAHLKRRYLEGKWEHMGEHGFFDPDALMFYEQMADSTKPWAQGGTEGDIELDMQFRKNKLGVSPDPIRLRRGHGGLMIWRKPDPNHRYIMAIDVSSGGSFDYSAIQVVDIDAFEQVAEWQGKIDPDLVAAEAYRLGRLFNNATAVPEITGGWGFSVEQEMRRFRYPRMYTQPVLDRLTKKWTDRVGWDTTTKSRAHMLDTLERVLREMEFGLFSPRAVAELGAFQYRKKNDGSLGKPEARDGANDDLVMALAIAVTVAATERPRQVRKRKPRRPLAARPWENRAA